MATSLLSTDEQNFIHFGIATVEEIPRILRILLESEIQPHDLPKAVRNCSTIKLFQDQRNLVCPKSANDPDYECFDVTLLYTLIRNLCPAFTPTKGWKATPSASEVLVGDDIARLRDLRNKSFAHVKNAFISDSEFKNLWSSLEDICKRMETQTKTFSKPYHNGLDKILRKELGTESIEFYQAMVASENQCIRRELNELSKNVGALVIEQRKKSSTLKICGPSIVEYGTDVEFYIEFDGESNNNIHSVSWIRREGAVSHEIDTKNEKYEGSLNEKLIIRNVSFEDNGKYQAIMLELNQTHIHSNQIELMVSGKIPFVTLSGPISVRFGDTAKICATIKSDLPILGKKWIKYDENKSMDIDIRTFKYQGSTLHVQTSMLIINNADFRDQCDYCFAVSNAVGEVRSDPFVLRVLGSVPRITIGHITDLKKRFLWIMTDITIDENSPPLSSILWSKDGKRIAEKPQKYQFLQKNRRSLCILNIDASDAGIYKCVVRNLVGTTESDSLQLGPPEISLKEGTDTEISTTFSARVISVPSVTSLSWENIITTDHGTQCIPIDIRDSMYQDSSNLCPFPKLVVKKSKAVDLHKIKLVAENFIGKADVIVDVQEYIRCRQEDNLKRQENILQFYKEGPSKAKFLLFSDSIRESLTDGDLKMLKYYLHCLELPGYRKVDSSKIKELDTLLDFFSFLLSENYFSSTDVVFMQLLLRRIKREDLEKMCIKYATEDSKALCYFAESETPVNGHTHVHFHISENIINYPREYAEKIRETIAVLVGCPTDCKDCLRLDGIRQTSSFNLVFEMKNEYVQKLLNVNPGKFEVLGRYSVDKIIVGGQTIHIDSSEMYHQQKMLQELTIDDATYYETSAYKAVFEKMMKTNVVVLVGEPGCGKTSLAHHLALQFKEHYHCRPISNITDINHLFQPSKSQFFLLNLLAENMPHPFLCLDGSMTRLLTGSKLLITCSNDTFNTALKCQNRFEQENVIHFDNYAPAIEGRLSIFRKYCAVPELTKNLFEDDNPAFFPLLCRLYSSIQSLHCFGLQFFKEPWLCLHYELNSLIRRDSLSYASLVLCVLHKNKISQEILEKSSALKVTLQTCNVDINIKISDIQDSLANMLGSFVSKNGTHFRISHPLLFSVVSSHYGKSFGEAIINNVSIDFLINEVDLKASVSVHLELEIHSCLFLSLAKRFHEEIRQGRPTILKARIFLSSEFVEIFLKYLKAKTFEDIKKYYILDRSRKTQIDNMSGMSCLNSKSDSSNVISFLVYYGHVNILRFLTELVVSHNQSTDLMFGGFDDQVKHLVLASYNGDRILIDFVLKFMQEGVIHMYNELLSRLNLEELHLIAGCLFRSQTISLSKEFDNVEFQFKNKDDNKTDTTESAQMTFVAKLNNYCTYLNRCHTFGNLPLISASEYGFLTAVDLLIHVGADINKFDKYGDPPLLAASRSGYLTVVEKLINHGADINQCIEFGDSPLIAASQSGHLTVVEKLINHGASINQCNVYGDSPLTSASQSGHLTVVEKLINHGADINQCNECNRSPLIAASQSGNLTVVEKLISHGANINQCHMFGDSPLASASQSGHLTVVEKLINHGADINQCNEYNRSPLIAASQSGHLTVVEKLISHGACINQCAKFGEFPLFVASQSGHLNVVEKLINCGADINQCNKYGRSPLYVASQSGHLTVVKKLTNHGANINQCDNCGNYPLSATFRSSQQPVVEEFIEHGKTLNERSSNVHYESIMKSEINELVNKEKDRFNEYMNEKPQSGKQLKTSSQELYKTRSEVVKIPYDSEIYSRSTNDFAFERSERNRKYLRCEIQ